jgi:hypothetical protein
MKVIHLESESKLPTNLKGPFQLWQFSATHGRLLLRRLPQVSSEETIDIAFYDTRALKVRATYSDLHIAELVDPTEALRLADIPARHRAKYLLLGVSDGEHEGFVVCGTVSGYAGHWPQTADPHMDDSVARRDFLRIRSNVWG